MVHLEESEVVELLTGIVTKFEGLSITDGSEKGEGYYGHLTKVDLEDLHLMIKSAPRDEKIRKVSPWVRPIYLRESRFYEVAAPKLLAFQAQRSVSRPFTGLAKHYKSVMDDCKEVIVLENMKAGGFRLFDCKVAMDAGHISFVLEQYGKFHAISFGMKDQDPKMFEDMTKGMDSIFKKETCTDEAYGIFIGNAEKLKPLFDPKKDEDILRTIDELVRTMKDYVDSFGDPYDGGYAVLTHGDSWGHNLLFRYQVGRLKNRMIF